MAIILDRYEGDFAICEVDGRKSKQINKVLIDINAKEGDVLAWRLNEATGRGLYMVDKEATARQQQLVKGLYNKLKEGSKKVTSLAIIGILSLDIILSMPHAAYADTSDNQAVLESSLELSLEDKIADMYSGIRNENIKQMYIDGTNYYAAGKPGNIVYQSDATADVYDHPWFARRAYYNWHKSQNYFVLKDRAADDKSDATTEAARGGIEALYDLCCETKAATLNMPDEQKLAYIMGFVRDYFSYDYNYVQSVLLGVQFESLNTNFFENVLTRTGVCTDFSMLFNILSSYCGLDSRVISGELNGYGHSWNAVTINEVRYNIEPQRGDFIENMTNNTYIEQPKADDFETNYLWVIRD